MEVGELDKSPQTGTACLLIPANEPIRVCFLDSSGEQGLEDSHQVRNKVLFSGSLALYVFSSSLLNHLL